MASSRKSARRTFEQHFRSTFGDMDTRKLQRRCLLALGVAAILVTGAASADWRVYDDDVDRVLQDIRDNYIQKDGGSVTTHLKTMNDRLAINGDELSTAEESPPDDMRLVQPTQTDDRLREAEADRATPTQATSVGLAERCPGGATPGTGIPAQQRVVCRETYQTEIARYRFSLEMYKLAETRNTKLRELVQERNNLDETDFGKMEENSNKLLALQVQMDNDRDRYQTYMQAYQARVDHLVKTKELLAEQVMNGNGQSGGVGGLPGGIVGGAVLLTALEALGTTPSRDNPFD